MEYEDLRTLPEHYISIGDCRAYIGEIEPNVYSVRWTCGKETIMANPKWVALKGWIRNWHRGCPNSGGEPQPDSPPSGPNSPDGGVDGNGGARTG